MLWPVHAIGLLLSACTLLCCLKNPEICIPIDWQLLKKNQKLWPYLTVCFMLHFISFRALTLSSLEVRFHMDSETHDPIDLQTKELM